ncbi:DUF4373 domain-containing protein [Paenibacillus lentus]|uniref:DUF4373 domain-containing protein n=1 Tax=Paenibacillus lentus TaxID=1338368 RepID=UPI003654F9CF
MKEVCYFPHDSTARNDPKISAMRGVYGAEGYGWYWILIEMMRESEGYRLDMQARYAVNAYASQMHTDYSTAETFITACIEFGLFLSDGKYFWCPALCRRMDEQKASGSGKGKRKQKRTEYPPDSTYYKMAVYFKEKIDAMAAAEGLSHLTNRTNLQVWADDFRKLVELDKHSDTALIKSVMDWAVNHHFWKRNVLSAEKFRDKFPKLVLEMRSKPPVQQKSYRGGHVVKPAIPIVESVTGGDLPTEEEMSEYMKLAVAMQARKQGG